METSLLNAVNLHKAYVLQGSKLEILKGADLVVQPGETVAIVGRSGAGKSTLLHVLGGLDRPKEGTITLKGINLYRSSARTKNRLRAESLGFVFQAYHLLPEMDIVENVMLPAMASGKLSRKAMREKAIALLTKVGLADRLKHRPQELSGGEQQRAAIARALINDPQLILADEPTGNLDPTTGQGVLDLLFELVNERQAALVMVTHNLDTAHRCQRVLTLHEGLLVPEDNEQNEKH